MHFWTFIFIVKHVLGDSNSSVSQNVNASSADTVLEVEFRRSSICRDPSRSSVTDGPSSTLVDGD